MAAEKRTGILEEMPEATKANNRALALVYATIFLDVLGLGVLIPVLPYYAQQFSADAYGGHPALHFMLLHDSHTSCAGDNRSYGGGAHVLSCPICI